MDYKPKKIMVVGDTHFRASTPVKRIDDFAMTGINKLNFILETANKEKCEKIFFTGDIFHTYKLNNDILPFIYAFSRFPLIDKYTVIGNHDIPHHNESKVLETPLGLLDSLGYLKILPKKLVCPDITVYAKNYYNGIDKDREVYHIDDTELNDSQFNIVIAHSMLVNDEVPFDHCSLQDEFIQNTKADIVITGHDHLGYGVKKFNNTYFFNPGSVLRSSISEINRTPKVYILTLYWNDEGTKDIDVKIVNIPIEEPEKTFNLLLVDIAKEKEQEVSEFVKFLSSSNQELATDVSTLIKTLAEKHKYDNDVVELVTEKIKQLEA
jgi:predicted phosphodiesterase